MLVTEADVPSRKGRGVAEGYTVEGGRHVSFAGSRIVILALRFALEDNQTPVIEIDPSQVISIEPESDGASIHPLFP